MVIPRSIVDAMTAQAQAEMPNEACGLLGERDGTVIERYPIRNVDESPVHFTMEPREQLQALIDIEDRGWATVIYHSHTHTRAYPSATDIRHAAAYPDAVHLIVSLAAAKPDVRAFRIIDGEVTDVEIQIAER